MADGGANHPAVRTLRPPSSPRESGVSGARLVTPKPYVLPPSMGRPSQNAPPPPPAPVAAESGSPFAVVPSASPPAPATENSVPSLAQLRKESSASEASQPAVASAWGEFATAPTLLLTAPEGADPDDAAETSRIATPSSDDAAETSRIVTPSAPPLEDQPWYRTGTTLPPPSLRPPAESAPAIRNAPSPRVLKIVTGVIGGCLFIVAIAGAKLLYKRSTTPAEAPVADTAVLARPTDPPSAVAAPQPAPTAVAPVETPPAAPATAGAAAPEVHRSTPARPSTPRAPVKPAPRRAPAPKKVGKSTR